jgi:hypothetical protein
MTRLFDAVIGATTELSDNNFPTTVIAPKAFQRNNFVSTGTSVFVKYKQGKQPVTR